MDLSVAQYLGTPPGDAAGLALRDVLVMNYESLTRQLVRKLGCPDLACESLHEAWLRLGEATVGAPVQSPRAYVYRVACNVAMDRLRGMRTWPMASEEDIDLAAVADPAPGPQEIAEKRCQVRALDRALQRLPRRHRAVMVALRVEEMTRQEVADWLDISLRTVDTALRQALAHCTEGSDPTVRVRGPRSAPGGVQHALRFLAHAHGGGAADVGA